MSNVDGEDLRTACLPLNELLGLLLEEIRDRPGVNISGEHKVLGADQGKDKAWVDVETSEGVSRLKVDYVVGCDGAHSQVRKSMFGDNFPGFTWDVQPCSTDVSISKFQKVAGTDVFLCRHTMTFKENLASQTRISSWTQKTFL